MSRLSRFGSFAQRGSIQTRLMMHNSLAMSFGITPSIRQSTTASAVALCTTPPYRSMFAESFSVTLGTRMVAGRTSWLQARIANMAVWPLLCAIMFANACPTGPEVRPIRISGIASVNWPSRAITVASPVWKRYFWVMASDSKKGKDKNTGASLTKHDELALAVGRHIAQMAQRTP